MTKSRHSKKSTWISKQNKSNKEWRKLLDETFSKVIRNRDKKCLKCSKVNFLHAHHIFRRNKMNTRWDLSNGITLCFHCHNWWHNNPVEATHWIESKLGPTRLRELEDKSNIVTGSWSEEKFKQIYDNLIKL